MPNWVATILTVTGDNIDDFISAVKGKTNLDFNTLVPMPKEEEENWYQWSVQNWGTKWNACHTEDWEIADNQAVIKYDTAWSVATQFFLTASKLYPNLTFKQIFADEGGWFVGKEVIIDGKVIKNTNYHWDGEKGIAIRKLFGYYYEDSEEDDLP